MVHVYLKLDSAETSDSGRHPIQPHCKVKLLHNVA